MRLRAGIVALVAVLALTACGGSSKSSTTDQTATFKTNFKAVTGQLKQTSHAIGIAIQTAPSKTNSQLAATFGNLATQWGARSGQLSGLHPPASVGTEFSSLRASAGRVLADLTAVSSAVVSNSVDAARRATGSLVRDILRAKAAATAIDAKLGIT
jgi:hypothetical protein